MGAVAAVDGAGSSATAAVVADPAAIGPITGPVAADPVTAELAAMVDRLAVLAAVDVPADDAARIDRIALVERVKAAAAAVACGQLVAFARSQVDTQIRLVGAGADGGFDPAAVGRGIAEQIGLACGVSPFEGARRLGIARALDAELPGVAGLLRAGRISEYTAGLVVTETRHLTGPLRRRVDEELVGAGIAQMSPRQAAMTARRWAYRADPAGFVARGRTARCDRRVGVRPAPDTMALLTGYLPAEQGVACWAALRRHTDAALAAGDGRTRGQIMADTLVERLTGQATAADVPVEVGLVMGLDTLIDPHRGRPPDTSPPDPAPPDPAPPDPAPPDPAPPDPSPPDPAPPDPAPPHSAAGAAAVVGPAPLPGRVAELTGYGPLPAELACQVLATTGGRRWWRRLFTRPAGGPLVGADPRRRRFDGVLAHLITVRDGGRCRDPYCDAPIRHLDHIVRHRDGGPTSLANGRGTCARGNQVRELPGWRLDLVHDGRHGPPHTVATTTPTGHTYHSRAGPSP